MDLKSIINTEAGENSARKQAAPVTPIQTGPLQQGFRDYSHPPHVSPGKHPSQDYTPGLTQPYPSPTSYQGQGPYTRPPPPPPIQAPPQNDLRSPAGSYASHSAQSPYRQTPTSGMSNNQYPFPQSQQTPQSPAQQHQYPPSFPHRESYPQSNGPPLHLQQHNQGRGSPVPQTPPIGIPGSAHPYLQHHRSQSSLSTSTPTSTQSQQQYFNHQYPQDSPVSAPNFPPSQGPQRQQSQPGTPLGPPVSQRQSSGGFTRPTSPYLQRGVSAGPFSQFQTSPAPPPPASIPRLPSTPSAYDSQRTSTSEQRQSQSERERSLSVSPKTRLPSQPRGDNLILQQPENDYLNSGKRKMDDREIAVEDPRRITPQEAKPQVNGDNRIPSASTSSPQQPARKRIRYTEPPIWAQSVRGRKSIYAAGVSRPNPKPNGKRAMVNVTAHAAPPLIKCETNGHRQISPSVGANDDAPHPSHMLGPWEWSILKDRPQDQMTKIVADWLFLNVVSRSDFGELSSRGVEIEIEAKLGQLIDRETNYRYVLPVQTECVLENNGGLAFRSSMTEKQHSVLNGFLNKQVELSHPNNAVAQSQRRVEIRYLHRRETDKFYELPSSYVATLPPAIKQYIKPRQNLKVRVSHDQKSNEILAAIIKIRVDNLDIYSPLSPLDCRISVNFEMKYDGDLGELRAIASDQQSPDRNKDRLSYTQSCYQIDLTQVTQTESINGVNQIKREHELEIEVSTHALIDQGRRAQAKQPNEYQSLVEGFLNNVRVLAKRVPP